MELPLEMVISHCDLKFGPWIDKCLVMVSLVIKNLHAMQYTSFMEIDLYHTHTHTQYDA